ncbi:glycosyltransferase family 4 protein [Gemmatimonadota bacterium]
MSARVLLISGSYPPEIRSASHLIFEMATEFRDRGHEITVLTSMPVYNLDEEAKRDTAYPELAQEEGISVIRVGTLPRHKVNHLVRGFSELLMPWQYLRAVRRHLRGALDAVVVSSPPLTLSWVGEQVKRRFDAPYLLSIQDIFPKNAIDIGALRSPLIIRFSEWMERKAYRRADRITVHSQGNLTLLEERRGVPRKKLSILPNWVSLEDYQVPADTTSPFRQRFGLEGKFVFLHAGVVGPSQNLELVVRAAARVKDLQEIRFLLIGDGTDSPRLERLTRELGCSNVVWGPYVSREQYPALVREMDVGLVSLSPGNETPVVPSKILGYMASSVPVIGFLNKESDAHSIIKSANCGLTTISDDFEAAVEAIRKVYASKDKLREWGENGRDFVSTHFERKDSIDRLEALLRIGNQNK